MLFGYPIEATAENWFHECLVEIIQTIHTRILDEQDLPTWPEMIPEIYRERLSRRDGLRKRLVTYQEAIKNTSEDDLNRISIALSSQNEIAKLLSGACNCVTINELPESIRDPVSDLFKFGFELLSDLEIRDHQYQVIYDRTPYHVCPFCGCEYFDAPGAPREALDHFLAESKYPFAATNLCNLVPMGNKCNSKYKLAQDILYKDDGTRRRSIYPYDYNGDIKISVERSIPFAGTKSLFPLPEWQLDIVPETEEISTWISVFHIEERYKRDILDADFISWLREFSAWCRSSEMRPIAEQNVINALERYIKYLQDMGIRDRAFLKAAVFQMLYHHYQQGDQRLIILIDGVVIGGTD
jgi:hypothetical protein